MIKLEEYEDVLRQLGTEYFVTKVEFVADLANVAREGGISLGEPGQPMVVVEDTSKLKLLVQSEVKREILDGVIRGLGIRWALKNTATDVTSRLESVKKRLGFCFLKDYARTVPKVGGDELREDEWAMTEMERLGFFNE